MKRLSCIITRKAEAPRLEICYLMKFKGKFAPLIWGFPIKFLNRMEEANKRVILVAGDGGWSEGFDDYDDLERLHKDYDGGIWSNRIDVISLTR